MNCADNTGAKNLFILSVKGIKVRQCVSQFQAGRVTDLF
jgi:ribosomal protein L14